MLNLALQMSLEPDANTPVRPGPDEPKPTAEAEKPATAVVEAAPTADAAAVEAVEAPAPAVPDSPAAPPTPTPDVETPSASAKKPRKKQKYKDLIGGMMKQQDVEKKVAATLLKLIREQGYDFCDLLSSADQRSVLKAINALLVATGMTSCQHTKAGGLLFQGLDSPL